MMIGVDYHPSFQQIAFFLEEAGEFGERQLNHRESEAERFYRDLKQRGIRVRVGMAATGCSRWFERLLAELGFEVWIGDPAEINQEAEDRPGGRSTPAETDAATTAGDTVWVITEGDRSRTTLL